MNQLKLITNPISNIPVNKKSHVHGWTQVWSDQLDIPIDHKCSPKVQDAALVYVDHGANFGGTLNLFGGANDDLYHKINRVVQAGSVISLDHEMPNWGEQLRKRIGNNTTSKFITESWCDWVSDFCKTVPSLKQEDMLSTPNICLGDSHSIAFAERDSMVLRNDGKTLFGATREGIANMFRGVTPKGNVTLSFGSIDIRHHILRREDLDLDAFIQKYVDQGRGLEDDHGCNVMYAAPVPVEWEGRKIPKTGFYKKTPFYGSMEERKELTSRFINILYEKSGGKVVMPPEDWYTMDEKQYAEAYMELGSSFHIAPPFYRKNNWGLSLWLTTTTS